MTTTLLPSIRSRIGDQFYYVSTLSFSEVAKLTPDDTDFVGHEHEEDIKGSIIIGVRGGSPDWTPLRVNIPDHEGVTDDQKERIEGCLGLLRFDGNEQFFVIEGKYQLAGIKLALENRPELKDSCVSVIFVSHECEKDKKRTKYRRQR